MREPRALKWTGLRVSEGRKEIGSGCAGAERLWGLLNHCQEIKY